MVCYSIFVAVFLAVVVPSCTEARAYSEDGSNLAGCRRDILLLLDASRSIGRRTFEDEIKPFLVSLVNNPRFTFGEHGVQLAIIPFSSEDNTRIVDEYKFPGPGDPPQEHNKISTMINEMTFEKLNPGSRDYTYTGKALQLGRQVFPGKSPGNQRPDVSDVVILFTDGSPRTGLREESKNQKELTRRIASDMRADGIRFITVAVGKSEKFREFMKNLSGEGDFFNPEFDNINTIIEGLVDKSCGIRPGKYCRCAAVGSATQYVVAPEMENKVAWIPPSFECNEKPVREGIKKFPAYTSPHLFGVGQNKITYSYLYVSSVGEELEVSCDVTINVEVCKCTDVGQVTAPILKPCDSKVHVSWKVPKPECITNDNHTDTDSAMLPYGETIREYHYEIGQSTLTCPVKIVVDAVPCAGKKYNPIKEECCCGAVHLKKDNHECCGHQYIDVGRNHCCPSYNVRPTGSTCPGE